MRWFLCRGDNQAVPSLARVRPVLGTARHVFWLGTNPFGRPISMGVCKKMVAAAAMVGGKCPPRRESPWASRSAY